MLEISGKRVSPKQHRMAQWTYLGEHGYGKVADGALSKAEYTEQLREQNRRFRTINPLTPGVWPLFELQILVTLVVGYLRA